MELVELSKEGMLKVVQGDIEQLAEEHDYSDKFYQLLCLEHDLRDLYCRRSAGYKQAEGGYEVRRSNDLTEYNPPREKFTEESLGRRVSKKLNTLAKKLLKQICFRQARR